MAKGRTIVIDKSLATPIYTEEGLRKWRREHGLDENTGKPVAKRKRKPAKRDR